MSTTKPDVASPTTERHKELTAAFFARFSANDFHGVLATLTDDATWWIAGKPAIAPAGGLYDKAQTGRLFERLRRQLRTPLLMTVKGLIAEGDKVAVELESRAELHDGRIYNNEYHCVVTIRGDKIAAVREYSDTQHVFATFFQPAGRFPVSSQVP